MEWIRQMDLKKSLFTIAFINSIAAIILSVFSFFVCVELNSAIAPQGIIIDVHTNPVTVTEMPQPSAKAVKMAEVVSVFQIVVPALIYAAALISIAFMFYRLKLKAPLEVLTRGACRIIESDLDFMMEAKSRDELGQLCTAFETMRKALLDNNRELWNQAEDRKRLNAAFSHDLRNPVTVLKGAVKLAKQAVAEGTTDTGQLSEHLSLMENYTDRIERYIEIMSSIQRLEEIPLERKATDFRSISLEIQNMIYLAGADSKKQIRFEGAEYSHQVLIDKEILLQIGENLMANALRFANRCIEISCVIKKEMLVLSVRDDGRGFPASFFKNGIQPFSKGNEDAEHPGMGLYICKILAKRHGGDITFQDNHPGAEVLVTLKIR